MGFALALARAPGGAVAVLAAASLAACTGGLGADASPPHPSPARSASVLSVPDADVEFLPLSQTFPSAWGALGLEPGSTRADMWQVPLADGSVLSVESRDGGGAQIGTVAPGGATTPLTGWLPTDRGQVWDAIAYSEPWLVYADDAGSHTDGPASAAGVFLANTETGDLIVLESREYEAPRKACEECNDLLFVTEAIVGRDAVYWIVGGPTDFIYDHSVRSRPLAGGKTTDLLVGDVHFDDSSCVTTPGAEVRISGAPQEITENTGLVTWTWDLGRAGATLVGPPGGMTGGASNVEPSTCAGVDVVGWWTRLDGKPWDGAISKTSEDVPNVLLSAIDFVVSEGRARIRFDDDSALFRVTSSIDGWAVVGYQALGSIDERFLLLDTAQWRAYEVDAPSGTGLAWAAVANGRLLAYAGPKTTAGDVQADTLLSAELP